MPDLVQVFKGADAKRVYLKGDVTEMQMVYFNGLHNAKGTVLLITINQYILMSFLCLL